MKRNDLLALIQSYPEDTNFYVIGQGINEGTPIPEIDFQSFKDRFWYYEEGYPNYEGDKVIK